MKHLPETSPTTSRRLVAFFILLSRAAAVAALTIGVLALVGWWLDVPELRSIFPALVPINPVAAVCFLLSGISLLLWDPAQTKAWPQRLARLFALAVIFVGASRLAALYLPWDLGLDQLLFRQKLAVVDVLFLGRMASATALNFVLLGAAFFLLNSARHRSWVHAQWLSLLVGALSLLAWVEYAYGLRLFHVPASAGLMALNTALAFLLLSLGILFSRPERTPLVRLLTSDTGAGRVARWLLPLAILMPFLNDFLWAMGRRFGFYSPEFEDALSSLYSIALFTSFIVWSAFTIHRREEELRQAHQGLELRVQERTVEVSTAVQRLKEEAAVRERAQEGLRESEEFNRQIFNSAQEGLVVYDRNLRYALWNPFMEQLTGLKAQQVLGQSAAELFPFLKEQGILDLVRRALAGEAVTCPDLHFLVPATGRSGWTSAQYAPLRDARNEITGALGVVRDISQRKQAEDDIRRSAARYRELIENAVYGIYRASPDGRFLDANPALVAMLGYDSAQELRGLDISTQVYGNPADRAPLVERIRQEGRIEGAEVQWKRKDGSLLLVRLSGRALRDSSGQLECFEVFVENVTERRALERQVAALQKFEAIGQLAGGIAHDFNNVIGVMMGWAEIGLDQAPEGSPLRAPLQKIRDQAQRAAGLTRQLLAFARKQILEPRNINLNKSVSDVLGLLAKVIGEGIEIKTVLWPELLLTRADPAQVEQVLMNLCLNARDAMPGGGQLLIETQNTHIDEEYCRTHPYVQPGHYVQLIVSDTGIGMDEATLERIFEPFFTTKEQGKGTGLGLATVYGIVKQHSGFVQVYSEPGRGSVFHVYFRAADGVAESAKELAAVRSKGGTETILVAEDNHGMSELVREILAQEGYKILPAGDGEEAVELFRKHRDAIDLVLLDVIMPKLNGPEAYARICALKPGVPAIFATGYTSVAHQLRSLVEQGAAILQKPYTGAVLKQRIREALDGAGRNRAPAA